MKSVSRNRWTNKELTLMKTVLKTTQGHQKKAAEILSKELTNRTPTSIQVKLCFLAKQHPSLRKENIARRMNKASKPTPANNNQMVREVKSLTIKGNQLIITF